MRVAIVVAVACLSAAGLCAGQDVQASIKKSTNIPAQELVPALKTLAHQRGFHVVFLAEVVGNRHTQGAVGDLTTTEALTRLLEGTHLAYSYLDDKTVTILPVNDAPVQNSNGESNLNKESTDTTSISEVIVTAQKRTERLHDVPAAVTVLNTVQLADNNQSSIEDYFASVPGLNLSGASSGGGTRTVSIRGLITGTATNPGVAVIIDDVPFGSSTSLSFGSLIYPDLDPSDLERIEVLKGPQGTLYGAASLGGLIKYVSKVPSTNTLSGRVQVFSDSVDHGGSGYGVRGAVNVPLSDTFAVRVSGFSRSDPGYIENTTTGQRDINKVDVYGGHLSALWRPSEDFSLNFSVLSQDTTGDGYSSVNADSSLRPTIGLQQTGIRGNGSYASDVRLYSATINAKLAALDLISITGYGVSKWENLYDITPVLASFAESYYGVSAVTEPQSFETKKFTQEFRLSSPSGRMIEWMTGLFYTNEDSPSEQLVNANNPTTGAPVGALIRWTNSPVTVSEAAVFGAITVHFTDRFDVQFGARESKHRQRFSQVATGILNPIFYGVSGAYAAPTLREEGNAFTYHVSPRFNISPDLMVYARLASGYRLGGPNINGGTFGLPPTYHPDRTTNYELGIKSDLLDRKLTIDASAYFIDWKDIQLGLFNAQAQSSYTGNGGRAKSEGLELSVQARPTAGLSIAAVASVSNAVLSEDLPATSTAYGLDGARLPFSSRFSGSLSAEQDIVHIGEATGYVGASVSYVGLRYSNFEDDASTPRFTYPAYTTVNVHTGARYDSWLVNLFVNNVADKRGVIGGGLVHGVESSGHTGYNALVIQPRTVGLSISKTF